MRTAICDQSHRKLVVICNAVRDVSVHLRDSAANARSGL